jgi:hypothetical protein
MVGITGSFDGISITGVAPDGTCCSSPANDNLIYISVGTPYLDLSGIGFYITGGTAVNIYHDVPGYYEEASDGGFGGPGTFTLTAVPEPSTWAMMLLDFAGLAWVGYRRSQKPTASVTAAKAWEHGRNGFVTLAFANCNRDGALTGIVIDGPSPVRVEHAIVTGAGGSARSRSFRTPAMLCAMQRAGSWIAPKLPPSIAIPRRHAY